MSAASRTRTFSVDRMIFLLVILLLGVLWAVVLMFTSGEREQTLERAREQLQLTLITLADFNELALQVADLQLEGSQARTDALWHALLQYPAASIWVESDGEVTGGLPAAELAGSLLVEEAREKFVVYAALPEQEAMADWRQVRRQRYWSLALVSIVLLGLTHLLVLAIRRRTEAERESAAAEERNQQLELYREKLEHTVEERTGELADANLRLGDELKERKAAEATLREHDALLSSVTKGAGELLGAHNNDEAIDSVLELIGKTVQVSRVQLLTLKQDSSGQFHANPSHEWCAPGLDPLLHDPAFQDVNLSQQFPAQISPLFNQGLAQIHLEDIDDAWRERYARVQMLSTLHLRVMVEGEVWGSLCFIDSVRRRREWTWAQTDTLRTLADLVGAAMTRARYVKELAVANTIVQNSPTILYRLQGKPAFPLIYISHNITKFGHDAAALIDRSDWVDLLVEEADRSTVREAMSRMLASDGRGAALEFRLRTGSGDTRWVENRYTPIRDAKGRLEEVEGIIIDITERKAAEEKIAAMARTDGLTGLANRNTFNERLNMAFAATRRGGAPFAVFYMDLDRFKSINDTLGHAVGDELLKETASRLRKVTRETDLVARLGGDEFAVLQMDIREASNAGDLAHNIQQELARPLEIDGNELRVSCSIGICPWSPKDKDPESMLVQADLALYRAKEDGRNCYRFHSPELDREVLESSTLADELRIGIERGELELGWQPQVSIGSNDIAGMEALVRWRHPRRGLLAAAAFVPVAEKTGFIMALGNWVLESACKQLRAWRDEGIKLEEITINLSLGQLKHGRDLIDAIQETTRKWQLQPQDIEFDVTEAMLAQATWTRNDVLTRLRDLGYKIGIDNFGTEYSSFEYLHAYAVNHLKVGRVFIQDAVSNPSHVHILKAIIQLATELGLGVIIEGVETREQSELLQELQASIKAQGYYYSQVVGGSDAGELLKIGHTRAACTALPSGLSGEEPGNDDQN
jgi:diguanylate cyclase (GGDEF)-like protein/PAS domain S-box-containing protein